MIKRTQESNHVVSLTLERPEVFNALSFEVLEELSEILDGLLKEDVRALIVTGSGKSFCSGADLKEIITFSPEKAKAFSLVGPQGLRQARGFPLPGHRRGERLRPGRRHRTRLRLRPHLRLGQGEVRPAGGPRSA